MFSGVLSAQVLDTEDFEDASDITSSRPMCDDGNCSTTQDAFNVGQTCASYTGGTGNFFWAQDMDATTCSSAGTGSIVIDLVVPVVNNGQIDFCGLFGGSLSSSPAYDAGDGATVEFSTDGGTNYSPGLSVTQASGNNLQIGGTLLTSNFQQFSFPIGSNLGGTTIKIRVNFTGLNSGAESLALDEFQIKAVCGIDFTCPVVECTGATYQLTYPYVGSQPGITVVNNTGSGTVTFDPSVVDGTLVISGIDPAHNWDFNLANGCTDAFSGTAISCSAPTCPLVGAPAGTPVTITPCFTDGATSQAGQDALADGDPTLATPYGTWRGAVTRAAALGVLEIVFIEGHYISDNTVAFAWGSPALLPANLAGLTVYGNNSVVEQAVGGTQVSFIQIDGVDNVTINDLNFINFDNPAIGSIAAIHNATGIVFNNITVDGSDRSGDAFVIQPTSATTEVTFYCSEFYNHFSHNPPNSVMTIWTDGSAADGSHTVTANFVDTEWRCNNRNGYGGALTVGNPPGGDPAMPGASVNFWGGIFSGNVANATDGGAIHISGETSLFIDGTDFECNSNSGNDGSGGGAINVQGDSDATILNANFTGNVSRLDGGAITFYGNGALRVEGTEFHDNIATGGAGGGIFYRGKNAVTTPTGIITNCYFSGNTDGIYFEGVGNLSPMGLDITSSTFTGNLGRGLAIESSDDTEDVVNLCNSVFCSNGGDDVFQNFEPATLNIDDNTVIGTGAYAQNDCSSIGSSTGYLNASPAPLVCGACLWPSVSANNLCSSATIGNYIWVDEDADGLQDAGEPGLSGVTVTLINCNGDCSNTGDNSVYTTTTTDINGGYIFSAVPEGTYQVVVTMPSGMTQTYDPDATLDNTHEVTVVDGDEYLDADFGYNWGDANGNTGTGAIGDQVWIDADGDGIQQYGEPGLGGVTLTIYYDSDGDGDIEIGTDTPYTAAVDQNGNSGTGTTTTEDDGSYIFSNLPAGQYVIVATAPGGYTQTGDPDAILDNQGEPIVVAPGDVNLLQDFGYQPAASSNIGDLIFFDANGDGDQDAGELGIAGVTVSLLDADGDIIATDVTDSNGNYLFTGLPDGDYTVLVTDTGAILSGLTNSAFPTGGGDGASALTLAGTDDLAQDFGYTPLGQSATTGLIGDAIFLDLDGNGAYTPGEGIEDVNVTLTYCGADGICGGANAADDETTTTTTNENGNYYFAGLGAGNYEILVDATTIPYDVSNTVDPNGGNDNTSAVTLAAGEINLIQDFGYAATNPGTIGNLVWNDINANGSVDGGEAGITGATVALYVDTNGDGILDSDDVLLGTETTSGGSYSFANIPTNDNLGNPIDYLVVVTDENEVLNGYWHSEGIANTDNNSQNNAGYPVTLDGVGGTTTNTTADFGYYILGAAVGNYVWIDYNGDGIQDATEVGEEDIEVTLTITYPDGTVVTLIDSTDVNGFYDFGNLLLDEDYDGSGVAGAGGDEPLFELSVTIGTGYIATLVDVNTNGNDSEDSDDHDGVAATLEQGQTNTATNANPTLETTIATYDFGLIELIEISGMIQMDSDDDDGTTPAAESATPYLGGVTVNLIMAGPNGTCGDGDDITYSTTSSTIDGTYNFNEDVNGDPQSIPAGIVCEINYTPPAGFVSILPDDDDANTDNTVESDNVTILGTNICPTCTASGGGAIVPGGSTSVTVTSLGNNNFGIGLVGSISGTIFLDNYADGTTANLNGDNTGTDAVITTGVTVTLYTAGGAQVGAPIMTDGSGNYSFGNLPPGDYYVEFTPPVGYLVTTQNVDADATPTEDSDFSTTTYQSSTITIEPSTVIDTNSDGVLDVTTPNAVDGTTGNNNYTQWDIGLYQPITINGILYTDPTFTTPVPMGTSSTITVYYDGGNGDCSTLDGGTATVVTTTDASGAFSVTNLPPGLICDVTSSYGNTEAASVIGALTTAPSGTVINAQNFTLPVELISFDVEQKGCSALLSWSTATEENAKQFVIEASENGRDFTAIGQVAAAGNSSEVRHYSFEDANPDKNKYYRLKVEDLDGSYEYSNTKMLMLVGCGNDISIHTLYPNPVKGQLYFNLNSSTNRDVHITITNVSGKIVRQFNNSIQLGDNQFELDVEDWVKGIYFIQAKSAEGFESQVMKFIKL